MKSIIELRWHGRGGQGAKTASLLLAESAFLSGKYVQGFPEYGPERMGAPITAYNRVSIDNILVHSNIYEPDYVIVIDETLLKVVNVTSGLKKDGAILINTHKDSEEIRPYLNGFEGKIYTIDARKISEDELGRNMPNTPMLGAIAKVTEFMDIDEFVKAVQVAFNHKFSTKKNVIDGNMSAIKRAIREVK